MKENVKNKIKSPDFYRHRLEKPLFILSVIISVVVFAFLSYLGYSSTIGRDEQNLILQLLGVESDWIEIIMKIGGYIAIAVIAILLISILISYISYSISAKADDVHVTEKQFPMLIKAEKEYGKKLGIKNLPRLFVSNEKEDLLVKDIMLLNPNVIRIPCGEIIASAKKNYTGAKFTIAKHLAYDYMGYFNPLIFILVIFSNWIPILKNTGNRLMTYSTDKIAAELIGKENAIDAIFESAVDIWFIEYMNVKEYMNNIKNVANDKDMFWAHLQRDIPIPAYRIDALLNNNEGKLF